ncbi:MAG: cyclic nucleotide-binding domain-containing protein [Acidimicrobiales bacterium]|nr:MAG: cyclic nucleotide-binding domain-containing protein [Acidimicrobiales bacterium]
MADRSVPARLADELAEMSLFAGLTRHQLEEVAGTVLERQVKAGKTVIKQGQWGHEFLLVLEGELEVRRDGLVVATTGPGSFVGELAVLDDVRRNATVVATTPAVIGAIEASLFVPLLTDVPVLADRIAANAVRYESPADPNP